MDLLQYICDFFASIGVHIEINEEAWSKAKYSFLKAKLHV